jgi:hypothetical protein
MLGRRREKRFWRKVILKIAVIPLIEMLQPAQH